MQFAKQLQNGLAGAPKAMVRQVHTGMPASSTMGQSVGAVNGYYRASSKLVNNSQSFGSPALSLNNSPMQQRSLLNNGVGTHDTTFYRALSTIKGNAYLNATKLQTSTGVSGLPPIYKGARGASKPAKGTPVIPAPPSLHNDVNPVMMHDGIPLTKGAELGLTPQTNAPRVLGADNTLGDAVAVKWSVNPADGDRPRADGGFFIVDPAFVEWDRVHPISVRRRDEGPMGAVLYGSGVYKGAPGIGNGPSNIDANPGNSQGFLRVHSAGVAHRSLSARSEKELGPGVKSPEAHARQKEFRDFVKQNTTKIVTDFVRQNTVKLVQKPSEFVRQNTVKLMQKPTEFIKQKTTKIMSSALKDKTDV